MAELITAFAALLWPVLALVLALFAYRPLARMIDSVSRKGGSIKIGEFELTLPEVAQQQQVSISDLQAQVAELKSDLRKLVETEKIVAATAPDVRPLAPKRRILWVDDYPENNGSLQSALLDQGYDIQNALSTGEALEMFTSADFDFIVSDLVRGIDRNAGLHLARAIKAQRPAQPIAIYCGGANADRLHGKEDELGVDLITASPIELMAFLKSGHAERS